MIPPIHATCVGTLRLRRLPFYRLPLAQDATAGQCFRFCASKGLDLFGLVGNRTECRCGASEANAAVWRYKHDDDGNQALELDTSIADRSGPSEGHCGSGVEVYRYIGWMERPAAGGVPWLLMESSPADIAYIDGIVHGEEVAAATGPSVPGLVNNPEAQRGTGKMWPQVFAVVGIRVFYQFAEELDPTMRSTFEKAALEFASQTGECVRFVPAIGSQSKHSRVFVDADDACGPDAPGYPGPGE